MINLDGLPANLDHMKKTYSNFIYKNDRRTACAKNYYLFLISGNTNKN
jgi:hypothetical protein